MYQATYLDGPLAQRTTPVPVLSERITARVGGHVITYCRQGQSGSYRVGATEAAPAARKAPKPRKIALPDVRPPPYSVSDEGSQAHSVMPEAGAGDSTPGGTPAPAIFAGEGPWKRCHC